LLEPERLYKSRRNIGELDSAASKVALAEDDDGAG
jgi:hypothetical protein